MSEGQTLAIIGDLIKTKNDKSKQIQSTDYLGYGLLPIVDQGAKLICGYTNDLSKIYSKGLPVIVFGDHTLHVKYINFNFAIGADGTQIISPRSENCDEKYLYYLIEWVTALIGSEGYKRHFSILKEFETPYFSMLLEQKKIATILTSVDDVIEKMRAQIDKLKDLKTGMLQELLTQGIGHTEFKDSPMCRIPKKWSLKKFAEVTVKIQDGTHFSPQSKTGEFLYITSKNIQNGKLKLDKISYISKEEHDAIYRRCDVSYGDVLLTKDGANTGNCAINTLKKPFSLLSSVAFLRCNQNLCINEYIYQYICSPTFQKTIRDAMTGNAITRLTLELIKNFIIPLPELPEQRKIVMVLSSIDNEVATVIAKLDQLLLLKKALMQDLLTGKVRVKVDSPETVAV